MNILGRLFGYNTTSSLSAKSQTEKKAAVEDKASSEVSDSVEISLAEEEPEPELESTSDNDGPGAGGGYVTDEVEETEPSKDAGDVKEESNPDDISDDDGPGAGGGYFFESLSDDDGPGAGGGYDGLSDGPGAGGGYDGLSDGPGAGGGYFHVEGLDNLIESYRSDREFSIDEALEFSSTGTSWTVSSPGSKDEYFISGSIGGESFVLGDVGGELEAANEDSALEPKDAEEEVEGEPRV